MKYEITYPDGSKRKFDNYNEFLNEAEQLKDDMGFYISSVSFKELEEEPSDRTTMEPYKYTEGWWW